MSDATEARDENAGHVSDLLLDLMILDELDGDELDAARAHLDACAACRAREKLLRDERAAFAASHLADESAVPRFDGDDNVVSLAAYRRTRMTRALGVVASVAAVLLVFVLLPREDDVPAPGERTKGSVSLSFFVKDAAGVRAGATGEIVHAGDHLRFVLQTKRGGHAAVLSRDGAGTVSVYVDDNGALVSLPAGEHAFPRATELDDVLGEERLYGFVCDAPGAVTPLEAAVRAQPESPVAPPGCVVDVLTIEKR